MDAAAMDMSLDGLGGVDGLTGVDGLGGVDDAVGNAAAAGWLLFANPAGPAGLAAPGNQGSQRRAAGAYPHIGLGYDVHAFALPEDRRPLILGGVNVPFDRGLAGHSDADVLCHAIADALLGAARLGDIGQHFPDSDPQYKGANSLSLLMQTGQLLRSQGFTILDIDSVIVAQNPRLAPYREAMRANIAGVLGLDIGAVGVKATTTEQLGFAGRGEGIAAQAVALVAGCAC